MHHLPWLALKGDGHKVVKKWQLMMSERGHAVDHNAVTGKKC